MSPAGRSPRPTARSGSRRTATHRGARSPEARAATRARRTKDTKPTRAAGRPDRSARRSRAERVRRPRIGLPVASRQKMIAAGAVALVVVLGVVAWFSPLLSVRTVRVEGTQVLTPDEVTAALDVADGTPLLRVDLTEAAGRVAMLPRVARVTVDRYFPSDLRVLVEERVPVVYVDKADGPHLLDATGVDFAAAVPPPGVPRLVAERPGRSDPVTTAALTVITSLPAPVRSQLTLVNPGSAADVRFTLGADRVVVWGTPDNLARKAQVLAAVLTQPGKVYDVSSPDLPTIS